MTDTNKVIKIFILLQLLDLLTTLIAVTIMGFTELNPLATSVSKMIILKIIAIVAVPIILMSYESKKLKFIALFSSSLVVLWNLFNMVMEVI